MDHPGWRNGLLPALMIVALGAPSGAAAVTKCVGPEGRVLYTNVDCPQGYSPWGPPPAAPLPALPAPAPEGTGRRTFLWALAGARNTVYLLGSLHLAPADLHPLGEPIESAYRRSATVVFEVDPSTAGDPAHQARLLADGVYPGGTSLEGRLSERSRDLLRRRLREAGLTPAHVERFKPWLCALVLTEAALRRAGVDPAAGIDRHLLARSLADGKQRVFLETATFQLELLTGLEENLQEEFLEKTLGDLDQVRDLYGEVVRLWRGGDVDGLAALLEPGARRFPRIHERFVRQRNRRWLERIREFLGRREDVLVVVGAAHLAGPDGLLALLRAAGHPPRQR